MYLWRQSWIVKKKETARGLKAGIAGMLAALHGFKAARKLQLALSDATLVSLLGAVPTVGERRALQHHNTESATDDANGEL